MVGNDERRVRHLVLLPSLDERAADGNVGGAVSEADEIVDFRHGRAGEKEGRIDGDMLGGKRGPDGGVRESRRVRGRRCFYIGPAKTRAGNETCGPRDIWRDLEWSRSWKIGTPVPGSGG